MSDLDLRLAEFLEKHGQPLAVRKLSPDASTREYFRIQWQGQSAIACVYPEPFIASEQTYLDVSQLFKDCGLPVATIYTFDEALGVIVQEDLGDTILRDVLERASINQREALIDDAIGLIARIQAATTKAYESNSIASRLKFDVEKLVWELNFFREHYFETLRKRPLPAAESSALSNEFVDLCRELEAIASVLCHRDFHAANLMIDGRGKLRIIDHQDARIGAASYDLVSLLLDRITELPSSDWLARKRRLLIQKRIELGLSELDEHDFAYQFRLQAIQRCLKATGTFSFQSANRGKTHFLPFIKPMFQIVLRAARSLGQFPVMQTMAEREIGSS
jgi:aminoglycoside/choline kinase family phosphotransferase